MSQPHVVAIHVMAADLPAARLDVMDALRADGKLAGRELVIQVGTGAVARRMVDRPLRVHAPFDVARFGAQALHRVLQNRAVLSGGQVAVLHAWSAKAAQWCVPLAADDRAVLIDVDASTDLRAHVRWPTSGCARHTPTYVCPSSTVVAGLRRLGVPDARCVIIPPAVDIGTFKSQSRAAARARLGIGEEHLAILPLPPMSRRTGTLTAAWATLLLNKAWPEVRLIVPAGGREPRRVRRLAEAGRHKSVARFATEDTSLPELLAASDVVAYLPSGLAPVDSLAWAMAAACPIVASAVPAVTEFVADGDSAWLCRPNDPEDAARQMLLALERPGERRQRAEQARQRAAGVFDCQRMVEAYRNVYARLTSQRGDVGTLRWRSGA